jgi:hypothetical protein
MLFDQLKTIIFKLVLLKVYFLRCGGGWGGLEWDSTKVKCKLK